VVSLNRYILGPITYTTDIDEFVRAYVPLHGLGNGFILLGIPVNLLSEMANFWGGLIFIDAVCGTLSVLALGMRWADGLVI